jgi:hypothetical protein
MKRAARLTTGLIILSALGCVMAAQFAPSRLGQAYEPRTSPEKIELFRSQAPTRSYKEIGTVSVCCFSPEKSVELLRAKASEQGGDALMSLDIGADNRAIATLVRYE